MPATDTQPLPPIPAADDRLAPVVLHTITPHPCIFDLYYATVPGTGICGRPAYGMQETCRRTLYLGKHPVTVVGFCCYTHGGPPAVFNSRIGEPVRTRRCLDCLEPIRELTVHRCASYANPLGLPY